MPRIMIKCPETNRAIYTGIMMPRATFPTSEVESGTIKCPHCGKMHEWSKADAYLEGEMHSTR